MTILLMLLLHFSSTEAVGSPPTMYGGMAAAVVKAAATVTTPTVAPSRGGNATSVPPTKAPTPAAPTMAPHSKNATMAPAPSNNTKTAVPTSPDHPSSLTETPSKSPGIPPPHDHNDKKNDSAKQHGGFSIWRMLGKTLAFLILLFLSVLAFGAVMNHRYRIYYFLRGLWYSILGLECTQWMLAKLGLRHRVDTSAMNTIIFDDNEISYGLLMQENE